MSIKVFALAEIKNNIFKSNVTSSMVPLWTSHEGKINPIAIPSFKKFNIKQVKTTVEEVLLLYQKFCFYFKKLVINCLILFILYSFLCVVKALSV